MRPWAGFQGPPPLLMVYYSVVDLNFFNILHLLTRISPFSHFPRKKIEYYLLPFLLIDYGYLSVFMVAGTYFGWFDAFRTYMAKYPPSTGIMAPVTYLDASEARNKIAPLRSSSSPNLLIGMWLRSFSP